MKIVLFDFDRTLTNRDTLRPVAKYFSGEDRKYFSLVILYFILVLSRFRIINDKTMKEFFLSVFIKGKELSWVNTAVRKYFGNNLESLINRPVFEALENYRKNSAKIYIVSANFDFLLEPLIELWGITGVICTQTEKLNGVFTGKITGETCKGKEKAARLRTMFAPQDFSGMTAYGDEGDREMLDMVGEAKLIKNS
ncbi:MAG: HAD-IB family hydrolase [Candidatus Omnitrophota bacterium]